MKLFQIFYELFFNFGGNFVKFCEILRNLVRRKVVSFFEISVNFFQFFEFLNFAELWRNFCEIYMHCWIELTWEPKDIKGLTRGSFPNRCAAGHC